MIKKDKIALGISLGLLLLLSIISLTTYLHNSRTITNELIARHVAELAVIFKNIDQDCQIVGSDQISSRIDFLTLAAPPSTLLCTYPERWAGPYLNENLSLQNKVYEMVKTENGLIITPGQGVVLSDGTVVEPSKGIIPPPPLSCTL